MVELGRFLGELGLSQYREKFADNDIDSAALLDLDEAHLKELGLSLGHRIRLMKAIGELRAAPGASPMAIVSDVPAGGIAPALPEARDAASRSSADGERRQLTVMFVDLVGSTELAARADPEDVRDVMRAYQDACAGFIARYDGYLAKFLGDGVLAYFGYPHAHEDAAERAVRAARGIIEAIGRLAPRSGHRLSVRIGIATGMVVVGAVAAPDGASELSAIGDAPNLAARLQALAEPNSVVIPTRSGSDRGRQARPCWLPRPQRPWLAVAGAGHCGFDGRVRERGFDDLVAWMQRGTVPGGDDVLGDVAKLGQRPWTP